MAAPKGNKYWLLKKNFNDNPPKYKPQALWNKFEEYCKWIDENPFQEATLVQRGIKNVDHNGKEKTTHIVGVPKMRPYTITGFYLFANLDQHSFEGYEIVENR